MRRLGSKATASGWCFVLSLCALGASAADDIPIATFEADDSTRQAWKHEGTAFANALRNGRDGQVKVFGGEGETLLSSLSKVGNEDSTGRTRSPSFQVQRKFIRFLVAGGAYPGRTCVNLLVGEKVVRSVAPRNGLTLEPVAFDVSAFNGETAQIELVDRERRPWGHISVDHILQTDTADTTRIILNGTGVSPVGGTTISGIGVSPVGGTAQTRAGRMEGDIQLRDGVLQVDEKPVPLETVHFVVMPECSRHRSQPHTVQLVNGEVWQTQIGSFSEDKLKVSGGLFANQVVDVASLAALDFSPAADLSSTPRPGVLYRTEGRPIPGTIVWIKENDIAVDCPLGILPLPRTGLVRYVFSHRDVERQQSTDDEISLWDGTILRGRLSFEDGKVVLEHPILKRVSLAWDDVRYLIRGNCGITWLADLQCIRTEMLGPLGPPPAPRPVDLRRIKDGFLSSVRVNPKTAARYRLPAGSGSPRMFRTVLVPSSGCRGEMTVSLDVSGQPIFKCELSPADPPQNLSIPLPMGDELVMCVDFGERLAYPCGVDFRDAHVTVPPAAGGE